MRANVWSGRNTVQVETVPDPTILNDRDAIVKISSTAICGSDLHLYDGYIPTMRKGDILGHEFMGEVVETGRGVESLRVGDRVVVPFPIACGDCWSCRHELYSVCENSNPNAGLAEKMFGHTASGMQMALGRGRATDVIDFSEAPDVVEQLKELTGGRGPDAVIDAVGMEAGHGHGALHPAERLKQATRSESDRGSALRDAIMACRPGGIVSIIGVYGGLMDKFPTGALMNKGLTVKAGQCHVQHYIKPLYERIRNGDIDPSFVVTHRLELGKAPDAYETFKHKLDECVKVVLKP
jgi:threonine dehydrogenase-like Zn-dependent dehydrogenase